MGMMQALIGSGTNLIVLNGGTADRLSTDPADAYAGFRFNTDGTIDKIEAATLSYAAFGEWYLESPSTGIGDSYWIRATLASGTNPTTGTMSSWLQLNSARQWYNAQTAIGSLSTQLTIEIAADNGGTLIVATGTYTLNVEVTI